MSVETLHLETTRPARTSAIAQAALRVETISDGATFAALRDPWNELLQASSSDTVFLTWEWLHTWWNHQSAGTELAIIAIRRGGELLAIAPFVSRGVRLFGGPRLSFLGTGRVGSDYLDVIVRRGAGSEAIKRLAAHLVEIGARLDLSQVGIPSSSSRELARELRLSGSLVRARRTHVCPYIDLGRSFDAYLASLGSEHRYNFQRKLRKLEKQHALRFETVRDEPRRRALLPVMFELHRLRWSERGGSDGLAGAGILEFHDEWSRLALECGRLRLFVLWLGEAPAATLYGFVHGQTFSFYQSGFDPRFSKLSVGLVTMGLAIRSAIDEGAKHFDFLHGEEEYKLHWARQTRRLCRIKVFPRGPLGRLAWVGDRAFDLARVFARRLPLRMRGRLAAFRRGGRE